MIIKVEDMFKKAGVDWRKMEINSSIDISDKNIKIKSYNEKTGENEFKKVLSLIRKNDTPTLRIMNSEDSEMFRASPAHRVYSKDLSGSSQYRALEYMDKQFSALTDSNSYQTYKIDKTDKVEPILDFTVEDNENYFANGILSHNTTPAGKALKFYSSMRIEIRKIEFITKSNETIGLKSRIKMTKNKTAPPMRKGEYEIIFGEGFQHEAEWAEFIIQYDIIKGKPGGSWFEISNQFNGDEVKVQGKATGVATYLEEHPDFKEWAVAETKKLMFPNMPVEEARTPVSKEVTLEQITEIVENSESVSEMDDDPIIEEILAEE